MRYLIFATLFAYGSVSVVWAGGARPEYRVWGIGQASCNQYVLAFDKSEATDFKHYMAGYLTGFSTASAEQLSHSFGTRPVADNLRALRDYCAGHRMDSFERALQALLLNAQAAAQNDKPVASWGRPPQAEAPPE